MFMLSVTFSKCPESRVAWWLVSAISMKQTMCMEEFCSGLSAVSCLLLSLLFLLGSEGLLCMGLADFDNSKTPEMWLTGFLGPEMREGKISVFWKFGASPTSSKIKGLVLHGKLWGHLSPLHACSLLCAAPPPSPERLLLYSVVMYQTFVFQRGAGRCPWDLETCTPLEWRW